MEKFVFETKINHIEDNSLLLVCGDFFYVLAVTTRLQEANWYQGRSKKYGEFKTIQNEGESTVWRYSCLVVKALNIPYLNILISSQVNVFASHASPLYKSVGYMTKCKWIRPRLLDYVDRFITSFVHLKFKKKRTCHLESLKRHSRENLL